MATNRRTILQSSLAAGAAALGTLGDATAAASATAKPPRLQPLPTGMTITMTTEKLGVLAFKLAPDRPAMQVLRIVANLATDDVAAADAFYRGVLGLDVLMDQGWIVTYGSARTMSIQLSVASEGGSGTAVPDLSIEVDDLDVALARVRAAGVAIEYGPVVEPWGVRRFHVRDPLGKLVNVLAHVPGDR